LEGQQLVVVFVQPAVEPVVLRGPQLEDKVDQRQEKVDWNERQQFSEREWPCMPSRLTWLPHPQPLNTSRRRAQRLLEDTNPSPSGLAVSSGWEIPRAEQDLPGGRQPQNGDAAVLMRRRQVAAFRSERHLVHVLPDWPDHHPRCPTGRSIPDAQSG